MKRDLKQSFWFHFLIVVCLLTVIYISFFAMLNHFTKHGQEVKIPNITGMDIATAEATLKALHFEVNVDSTYELNQKPLAVLKQVPDSGASVKEGRTVFLTVNMLTPPRIPMPNLVNLSFRSAEMMLRNNKLVLGDTSYKSDIAAGAILEQRFNGDTIPPGQLIAQGSKINLVIGDGMGNTDFDVPNVTGMSVDEATTELDQYSLTILVVPNNPIHEIKDTAAAIVVCQDPLPVNDAGMVNKIKAGNIITLKIEQTPSPEDFCHSNNNTNNSSSVK